MVPRGCPPTDASWALHWLPVSLTTHQHSPGGRISAPVRGLLRTRFHSNLSWPTSALSPRAPPWGAGGWRTTRPLQRGAGLPQASIPGHWNRTWGGGSTSRRAHTVPLSGGRWEPLKLRAEAWLAEQPGGGLTARGRGCSHSISQLTRIIICPGEARNMLPTLSLIWKGLVRQLPSGS